MKTKFLNGPLRGRVIETQGGSFRFPERKIGVKRVESTTDLADLATVWYRVWTYEVDVSGDRPTARGVPGKWIPDVADWSY